MSPPSCPAGRSRPAPWSGEHLPITATVFREGHDAVAANVVWTSPDGGRRPPFLRMAKLAAGARPLARDRRARPRGPLDLPRRGVERPAGHLAARRRGEGRGRTGRRGPGQRPRGGRPAARPGRQGGRPASAASGSTAAAAALRDTSQELTVRIAPALAAGLQQYLHEHPVRELVTRSPRVRGLGRPAAGALRLLVRVLPALGGPRRRRQADPRHVRATRRTGCPRSPTWASTSSTCRRSTRSARSTARARTPRSSPAATRTRSAGRRRLAVGDRQRRGRPRRRPPAAGHDGGLPRLRRPHPRARHGGGAGLRAAGRARPPVGRGAPGVVHHQARRHDRLRGEPAEEVPGHLPDQLRQRPRGHLRRVPAGDPGLDRGGRARSSASTTRTPSR